MQAITSDTQATTSDPQSAASASAAASTAAAATASSPTPESQQLASDLYALVVFLHKNCNPDLFAALGTLELTLTQTKLLHHLETQERELTLKEAAEFVHVSLPAASRTVDDLFRRGFVERHEDTTDRRMKRVSLTEHGRNAIRQLNAARLNGLQQFVTTLEDAERKSLSQALSALLERSEVAACRPSQPSAAPGGGGETE